jgi:mRNA interferase MazF
LRLTQGNIVWIDFNPSKGHEQAGNRPAVIVSGNIFNKISKNVFVCPVTNTNRRYPAHIPLDSKTRTAGFVMCDQIRTIDPTERNTRYIEQLPQDILEDILDVLDGVLHD